jgi:hypothetical protein
VWGYLDGRIFLLFWGNVWEVGLKSSWINKTLEEYESLLD